MDDDFFFGFLSFLILLAVVTTAGGIFPAFFALIWISAIITARIILLAFLIAMFARLVKFFIED